MFFFFNDTATTEIYTLSLLDALPISLMSVRAPVGDLNVAHRYCCIGRGLAAIHSKNNHQSFVHYTMVSLKKQLDVFNGEDRKSTRLNSSHANISYAVFCLKKKKLTHS